MSGPGTYRNPGEKQCWETCPACFRCAAKGTRLQCQNCSGRFDIEGMVDPDPDDMCRCAEGILQWKPKNGKLIQTRYRVNPYGGKIIREEKTEDERDWESYVTDLQNRFEDPNYNPIQIV